MRLCHNWSFMIQPLFSRYYTTAFIHFGKSQIFVALLHFLNKTATQNLQKFKTITNFAHINA